jgi:hypothetical protein
MEKTEIYEGSEKRKLVRLDASFPVMLKLYVRGRAGIITTLVNGETVNISLEEMCVELGLSDYIDITSLIESAMNRIGVDVGVELIVGGMNFKAIGEIMWFKTEEKDYLRIGIRLVGVNRDDRSIWNRLLLSLDEEAQTVAA